MHFENKMFTLICHYKDCYLTKQNILLFIKYTNTKYFDIIEETALIGNNVKKKMSKYCFIIFYVSFLCHSNKKDLEIQYFREYTFRYTY